MNKSIVTASPSVVIKACIFYGHCIVLKVSLFHSRRRGKDKKGAPVIRYGIVYAMGVG